MIDLFVPGRYIGTSGLILSGKVEFDAMSDKSVECAAEWIREAVGPFGSVEGVPANSGGIDNGERLAAALRPFTTKGPLLIVDDVYTTGGSMERAKKGRNAIGCVVFARGPVPRWIKVIWQGHPVTWANKDD